MKIKALILTVVLALSLLCACGGNNDNANANTEDAASSETNNVVIINPSYSNSGNFSETIIIENPSTDTVIVEMP